MIRSLHLLSYAGALGVLATSSFAQNDECATAATLSLGTTAFDTTTATLSAEPWPCAAAAAPDLWYVYTAANSNAMTFDTCGSSYDTALEILQGPCGAQTSLFCNDDDCGLQSGITVPGGMAGDVYYVRVGGFSTSAGAGIINVAEVPPSGIPNDECSGAIALGLGATVFDTTGALTSAPTWPCAAGGADIWYTYTAANTNTIRFETCGSSYDTALEVFSGTCGSLTPIACNDDFCGLQSTVFATPSAPGDTFYLRVGGFASNTGTGTLNLSEVLPPPNDDCASAASLAAGTPTGFDTVGASPSATPFTCGSGTAGGDLWYSYTPTSSSVSLRVETCGSFIDTILEAYEGSCGALVSVDCSDNFCFGQGRVNVTGVTAGQTYYFRVAGEFGTVGQGTIVLTEVPPPVQGCVVNPGFETGDAVGWSLTDFASPFLPAAVTPAGTTPGFGLFASSPSEGSFSLTHGFDASGPDVLVLSQDVTVNSGLTPITFDWRAGWDMLNFIGSTLDRTFDVVVRDPNTGAALQTTNILTAAAGTSTLDTGSTPGAVDLSMFLGQSVRVSFEWTVPEAFTGPAFFEFDNVSCPSGGGTIGTNYCMANVNSTGAAGMITAVGSPVVSANTLTLVGSNLPVNAFGFFLASLSQGFVPNPGGSSGNLCLGGMIGRYVGPGQIQNSGANGEIMLAIDLTMTPQPTGIVAIQPGETWNFTAWHRDLVGGVATSNLTDGLSIAFL